MRELRSINNNIKNITTKKSEIPQKFLFLALVVVVVVIDYLIDDPLGLCFSIYRLIRRESPIMADERE